MLLAAPAGSAKSPAPAGAQPHARQAAAHLTRGGRPSDYDAGAIPPFGGVYPVYGDSAHRRHSPWQRLVGAFLGDLGYTIAPPASHPKSSAASIGRTVTVDALQQSSSAAVTAEAGANLGTIASASTTTATTTTTTTTTATGEGGSPHKLPPPSVKATALTGSLAETVKKGLTVHYAVNEQVAGYFEVLIAARLARHLHIKGRRSKWLPKGAPGKRLIAGRLLVTTRKAHGQVRIKLPKSIAKRLQRLHAVTLTLRVVVHNAAKHPLLARSQSTVELRGGHASRRRRS